MAAMVCAGPGASWAQPADIEVPVLILETGSGDDADRDEALDLANVVQTAAKGVTTIQQAAAIVTVVTDSDIEQRGITRLDDVVDIVPGWMRTDALYNEFPFGLTRGTLQSMDKLRLRAFAYNAFNSRHYNPEGFNDYEVRHETLPNPYPDFRFVTSMTYSY